VKHFGTKEWELYKKGFYTAKQLDEMEEHLYECNHCLEIFLSLIEDEETRSANQKISQDFDEKVMGSVRKIPKHRPHRKCLHKSASTANKLITYYLAAAMVTIMLMSAGFFQAMARQIPAMALSFADKEKTECRVKLTWPAEVVSRTNRWIANFESGEKGGFDIE